MSLRIRLAGLFNVYNALAAIAFALQEGIPPRVIAAALKRFRGLPGVLKPLTRDRSSRWWLTTLIPRMGWRTS